MNDKEFMELKVLLGNNYNCTDRSYCLDRQAKALIEEGYHRTIWHKVADGALPKTEGSYLCSIGTRDKYAIFYYDGTGRLGWHEKQIHIDPSFITAWTELPEYKE